MYARMKTLAMWMRENDLPHNRKCLIPIAGAGLMSVQDIADAIGRDDSKVLDAALKKFSGAQRRKLEDAALRDAPKLARKEKMAAEETRIAREKETRARKGAGSGEGGDGGKGGKGSTVEVKKGAVTSMATAKSGRAQMLAAGTSKGELVVWKFSAPDASSDEEEEANAAKASKHATSPVKSPKKLSKKAAAALAAKEAKEKEEAEIREKATAERKARQRERARPPVGGGARGVFVHPRG